MSLDLDARETQECKDFFIQYFPDSRMGRAARFEAIYTTLRPRIPGRVLKEIDGILNGPVEDIQDDLRAVIVQNNVKILQATYNNVYCNIIYS